MVDRIVTGAHYGLRGWLVQRITSVIMAGYTLFVAGYVGLYPDFSYGSWAELFANQAMRSFSLLFLLAMYCHAWVGVRDIVMDYIKSASLRLAIYVIVIVALLLYAIWSVQILWGM